MTTHAQAADAVGRIHALAALYESALDPVTSSIGPTVWVGGGADDFAQGLTWQRLRVRQALEEAVATADRILLLTPETGAP